VLVLALGGAGYETIYRNSAVRAAVVMAAEQAAQQASTSGQTPALPDVQRIQDELQALNLPIGRFPK
jgi:hypothetical protein